MFPHQPKAEQHELQLKEVARETRYAMVSELSVAVKKSSDLETETFQEICIARAAIAEREGMP